MPTAHKTDFRKNMDSLLEGCTLFAGTAPAADGTEDWVYEGDTVEPVTHEKNQGRSTIPEQGRSPKKA